MKSQQTSANRSENNTAFTRATETTTKCNLTIHKVNKQSVHKPIVGWKGRTKSHN